MSPALDPALSPHTPHTHSPVQLAGDGQGGRGLARAGRAVEEEVGELWKEREEERGVEFSSGPPSTQARSRPRLDGTLTLVDSNARPRALMTSSWWATSPMFLGRLFFRV